MISSILEKFQQGIEERTSIFSIWLLFAFFIDVIIVIAYFSCPFLFSDDGDDNQMVLSLYRSSLLLVIFSAVRAISSFPVMKCLQSYGQSSLANILYFWLIVNIIVIILKLTLICKLGNTNAVLWSLLIGSFISCLIHLKKNRDMQISGSPFPERRIFLTYFFSQNRADGVRASLLPNEEQQKSTTESASITQRASSSSSNKPFRAFLKRQSVELYEQLRMQLDNARQAWSAKMNNIRVLVTHLRQGNITRAFAASGDDLGMTESPNYLVFDSILSLYTAPSVDTISQLGKRFEQFPEEMQAYVPQLTVFLLFGSFEYAPKLQPELMRMCEKSLFFGHRMFWFLHAFCLCPAGTNIELFSHCTE